MGTILISTGEIVLSAIAFCILIIVILIGIFIFLMAEDTKNSTGFFSSVSLYEDKQLLFTLTGKLNLSIMKMKDSQQAVGILKFVDKKGKPTDVPDGNVTVDVIETEGNEDGSVATAEYVDDGNKVTVKAVGPGVAALRITAKNAAGEDLPFEDIAIEVTAGDAVSGTVVFGEPTEQEA